MRTTTYDPYQHATELNAPVVWEHPGPGRLGLTHGGIIYLRPGQTARQERCTLSHEIVHFEFEDQPTLDHMWHARREARCDRIAAERLIDPNRFYDIRKWSNDPGLWCLELNITRRILMAYLKAHPNGTHRR